MNGATPITAQERRELLGHAPAVVWFTGLSGSGKSSLAASLEARLLRDFRALTYTLDGDALRGGLNRDLDFSLAGRTENIRRLGEVARLFYEAGLIVLTTFISPFRADREAARARIPAGGFIEVFADSPLEVCEQRDVKGLYRKARAGLVRDFTGIDSPYEPPDHPEITLATSRRGLEECVEELLRYLVDRNIIGRRHSL